MAVSPVLLKANAKVLRREHALISRRHRQSSSALLFRVVLTLWNAAALNGEVGPTARAAGWQAVHGERDAEIGSIFLAARDRG